MTKKSHKEGWSQRSLLLSIGMMCLVLTFIARHFMIVAVADGVHSKVGLLLDGTVDAADSALSIWVRAQERQAAQVVANDQVRQEMEAWLTPSTDAGPALSRRGLLRIMAPLLDRSGFEGFALIDFNGRVRVASDAPLSSSHPVVSTSVWSRLQGGRAAVTAPLRSPYMVSRAGEMQADLPVVFAGAPVVDKDGEMLGCLVFRVDPSQELYSFLEDLRVLSSGELYLMSEAHRMVSPSRFANDGDQGGLWHPVHVPAVEEGGGTSPTLLASAAVEGGAGVELEPYLDYRGEPVVGAWRWNEKLGVGIASEIDAKEAYAELDSTSRSSGLVAIGADLLLLLLGGIGWFARRREMRLQVRTQAIVDLAPVPIVLTTGQGEFIGANQAFLAMVRGADGQVALKGQALSTVVGVDGVTQGLVPPVGTVESDAPVRAMVKLNTPKGARTYRVVHQRLDPDHTGQRAVCTVAVDITEQTEAARKQRDFNHELEERVALRTAEVEAANAARTNFMAVMTHELRTPLHGVLGLLGLAKDASVPRRRLDLVRRALDAGNRLRRIVDEVLDFSELDRGELDLAHQDLVLSDVLGAQPDLLFGSTAPVPPRLRVHVHPDVPERLVGDANRLQQVVSNLVGNAVKFTMRGHIKIQIELRDPAVPVAVGLRTWLRISVSDTGQGFEPEMAERLFDSFSQADDTIRADFGGSGLGLAICRGFVERMGGRIWAEGQPGVGAIFTMDVPIEVGARQPKRRTGCALLISTDSQSRHDQGDHLRGLGLKVIEAGSLQEADACLVAVEEVDGPLHAVCLSANLLDRDGGAGLKRLRHALRAQGVEDARVVVLESPLTGEEKASTSRREADAVVIVPALRDGLEAAIWPAAAAPSSDTAPVVWRQWPNRRVLVVDDNPTNRFIMDAMLQVHGVETELAGDGAAGVAAAAQREFDLVLMDLHMPGLDGRAAGRRIRALGGICPELILVSAEPGEVADADGIFDGRLLKPLARSELECLLSTLWPNEVWPAEVLPSAAPPALPSAVTAEAPCESRPVHGR